MSLDRKVQVYVAMDGRPAGLWSDLTIESRVEARVGDATASATPSSSTRRSWRNGDPRLPRAGRLLMKRDINDL